MTTPVETMVAATMKWTGPSQVDAASPFCVARSLPAPLLTAAAEPLTCRTPYVSWRRGTWVSGTRVGGAQCTPAQ